MRAALADTDQTERMSAYERVVLDALGVEATDPPVDRWARAYAALSDAFTAGRVEGRQPPGGPDVDAVAALIHGARTFGIASRLLAAYPSGDGLTELGAGSGPFALRQFGSASILGPG